MSKKLIYLVSLIFLLGLSLAVGAQAEVVGWWRLDDGTGTTAIDSSASGNDGTLVGDPQWVAGKVGGALECDGGDYVDVPGVADINPESITLMTWVNFSTVDGADMERQDYLSRGDDYAFSLHEWGYRDSTEAEGKISAIVTSAGGWTVLPGTTLVEPDTWYHTTLTYDSGTQMLILYLDGEQEGELSVPAGLEHRLGGPLTIGTYSGRDLLGRIDDVKILDEALSEGEVKSEMMGQGFPYAYGPVPADGAIHTDTWVNISWKAGDFAVSHDVYLSDNVDDVDAGAEAAFQGNQSATFLVAGFPGFPFPEGLIPGTTYYWRIDEVNDAEPNSPWVGPVWSFMIPPKTAYYPDPADGAESINVNTTLSWTGGYGAKLHTVYFGDNFDDVNNAAGGLPQGTTTYTPGPLQMAKTYYWRVDEFDAVDTYKGEVWTFTTEGAVGSPNPANGAVDVKQTPTLSWVPGVFAASHQVYFGADKEAVSNADTGSPEYKGVRALDSESYDAGMLEWDSTYYWRIDEVNDVNPDSPWKGPVWSFTTANFLIIDDFEDYDAGDNQIWYAWKDGLGYGTPGTDPYYAGNGSGSAVGDENTPSYTEETIVHGGNQSMPLAYDNNKQGFFKYSEAELTLTDSRDWTEKGVNMLTIWFRGDSANAAEPLYVALNGSAVITHENPEAAQTTRWIQWNIDLQAFADQGVNLVNVNTIALGLGNKKNPLAGGSGIIYFDDIRLYPPAP
jgi:hypothetical protein